jgi:hypothetical protein
MILSQVRPRHGTRNVPNTTSSEQSLTCVCPWQRKLREGWGWYPRHRPGWHPMDKGHNEVFKFVWIDVVGVGYSTTRVRVWISYLNSWIWWDDNRSMTRRQRRSCLEYGLDDKYERSKEVRRRFHRLKTPWGGVQTLRGGVRFVLVWQGVSHTNICGNWSMTEKIKISLFLFNLVLVTSDDDISWLFPRIAEIHLVDFLNIPNGSGIDESKGSVISWREGTSTYSDYRTKYDTDYVPEM